MARKYGIQENYTSLISSLRVDPILPYLKDLKWLTEDEYETISSPMMNRRQKAEKILLLQPRKTIGGYHGEEILVKSIIWSGQEELVRKLRCTEQEIQAILRQRPFPVEPDYPQSPPGYYGYPPQSPPVMLYHQGVPVNTTAPPLSPIAMVNYGPGKSRVGPTPAVILYCQDDGFASGHVQTLSDFLCTCGVDCDIDQYHANDDIPDWGQWWEQKLNAVISGKGFVLFAVATFDCLKRCMAKSERIQMNYGFMSGIVLSTLTTDAHKTGHIIPVYLDVVNSVLLPDVLSQRTSYSANVRLLETVDPNSGIEAILSTPGLESLKSLVFRLMGQAEVEKPMVARVPPSRSYSVPVPASQNNTPAASGQPVTTITDRQLQDLADEIIRKNKGWRSLAVQLKVKYGKITEIAKKYRERDQPYQMLQVWKRDTNPTITYRDLKEMINKL